MNLRQTWTSWVKAPPYLEGELLGLLVLLGGHVRVRHLELQTEGRVHTVDPSVAVHLWRKGTQKEGGGGHRSQMEGGRHTDRQGKESRVREQACEAGPER